MGVVNLAISACVLNYIYQPFEETSALPRENPDYAYVSLSVCLSVHAKT